MRHFILKIEKFIKHVDGSEIGDNEDESQNPAYYLNQK